jgi:DNA-binding transcriptional LysR family regulator
MARPVRSAEIAELRAFCAAVDLGSLGRAARLLRVSQPGLSKRLRALEAVAGARLLERSPRGVRPTPAGNRLYLEARKLLAQAEAVDDLMAGLSDEEMPIRLAASHTIAEFVLPGPLVEFERRHERHLSVELVIANSIVVRELVGEGRAEFGIAALEEAGVPEGLQALDFCEDEVVVAVPQEHPWAAARRVQLADFLSTPMVMRDPSANTRRIVETALRERDLELAPSLAEVGSTSALRDTALSENAPVLLSRLAVRDEDELVVCGVRGLSFPRRFVFLLGGEESLTASARALLHHLIDSRP